MQREKQNTVNTLDERPLKTPVHPRIVCLSNIFDQNYHDVRGEEVERHLTIPFRRDIFQCLEMALGWELIVLSSPPKAMKRRTGKWLPPVETKFSNYHQLFCANWDIPKLRIPLVVDFLRPTCSAPCLVRRSGGD